jgi:hypothetical protein
MNHGHEDTDVRLSEIAAGIGEEAGQRGATAEAVGDARISRLKAVHVYMTKKVSNANKIRE